MSDRSNNCRQIFFLTLMFIFINAVTPFLTSVLVIVVHDVLVRGWRGLLSLRIERGNEMHNQQQNQGNTTKCRAKRYDRGNEWVRERDTSEKETTPSTVIILFQQHVFSGLISLVGLKETWGVPGYFRERVELLTFVNSSELNHVLWCSFLEVFCLMISFSFLSCFPSFLFPFHLEGSVFMFSLSRMNYIVWVITSFSLNMWREYHHFCFVA